MKTLRLGTRKSALAQAQAAWIAGRLRATFADLQVERVLITTSGDLLSSGGAEERKSGGLKALFTKEIEEALLDHRIDLAVHSLKDMAAELPEGLVIGAVPEREDARDVWISKTQRPLHKIPAGAKIGTGAVRRQAQLRKLLPQAALVAIRGNVDTRLKHVSSGELEGIILALAGLKRLGRENAATEILTMEQMMPALGQGCLGIQVRDKEAALKPYLAALDHAATHAAANAERAFLQTLGGTCQTPIAGHANVTGHQLQMVGLVISPDGTREVRGEISGSMSDAVSLGKTLAQKLLASGAEKILKDVIPE